MFSQASLPWGLRFLPSLSVERRELYLPVRRYLVTAPFVEISPLNGPGILVKNRLTIKMKVYF